MVTKRDWLVGKGLAKQGKGRFSQVAKDAISKAEAGGMVFDEPVIPMSSEKPRVAKTVKVDKPAKINTPPKNSYDAKAARSWAENNGRIEKGQRGRLPAMVLVDYLALMSSDSVPESKPVVRVSPKRVRDENVGWTYAKRRENDPHYISEPLVAVTECGVCHKGIGYCSCNNGPVSAKFLGSQPLMLTKPAV